MVVTSGFDEILTIGEDTLDQGYVGLIPVPSLLSRHFSFPLR